MIAVRVLLARLVWAELVAGMVSASLPFDWRITAGIGVFVGAGLCVGSWRGVTVAGWVWMGLRQVRRPEKVLPVVEVVAVAVEGQQVGVVIS